MLDHSEDDGRPLIRCDGLQGRKSRVERSPSHHDSSERSRQNESSEDSRKVHWVLSLQSLQSLALRAHDWRRIVNTKWMSYYLVSTLLTISATLVMHSPGLILQYKFHVSNKEIFVHAMFGALSEGTLILMLLTSALQTLRVRCAEVMALSKQLLIPGSLFSVTWSAAHSAVQASMRCLLVFIVTCFFLCTVVVSQVGDYFWSLASFGQIADMFIVNAGIHDAKNEVKAMDSEAQLLLQIIVCLLALSCALHWLGLHLLHQYGMQKATSANVHTESYKMIKEKKRRLLRSLQGSCFFVSTMIFYKKEYWEPVTHLYMCFFGGFIFSPEFADVILPVSKTASNPRAQLETAPNVIYIFQESMSGAYALNTDKGRQATPFFRSLLDDDNMFLFEHSRTTSSETVDALTALCTGCQPIDDEGKRIAFARSIGSEFKTQGYQTASFSSSKIFFRNTKWFMMDTYLKANMDYFADPRTYALPILNEFGTDDRLMVPHFEQWVSEHGAKPFYAQMYMYNMHWPYIATIDQAKGALDDEELYLNSLRSFDQTLRSMFDILEKTGQRENTVLAFSGDHGEYASEGVKFFRIHALNAYVLHPLSFMYIPSKYRTNEQSETLRRNQKKVVSTLDYFPTIQTILYGGSSDVTADHRRASGAADVRSAHQMEHCITGFDLLSNEVNDDRVALSWNSIGMNNMYAISTASRGLFVKDWPTDLIDLSFDECILRQDEAQQNKSCSRNVASEERLYWQGIVEGVQNHTLESGVSKEVLMANPLKMFRIELAMEEFK